MCTTASACIANLCTEQPEVRLMGVIVLIIQMIHVAATAATFGTSAYSTDGTWPTKAQDSAFILRLAHSYHPMNVR